MKSLWLNALIWVISLAVFLWELFPMTIIIVITIIIQTAFVEQLAPVSNVRQARDSLSALTKKASVAKYATKFTMLT